MVKRKASDLQLYYIDQNGNKKIISANNMACTSLDINKNPDIVEIVDLDDVKKVLKNNLSTTFTVQGTWQQVDPEYSRIQSLWIRFSKWVNQKLHINSLDMF